MLNMEKFFYILVLHICFVTAKSIGDNPRSQEDRFRYLENLVQDMENRIQLLNETNTRAYMEKEPIMFYAVMTKTHNLEKKSTVVFDKPIINTGKHYNEFDGVFVSPASGVYMFSWTACTSGSNFFFTELVIEDTTVSTAGEYEATGHYDCSSMTALSRMKKNDHAWIRTTNYVSGSRTHYAYNNVDVGSNSFMGLLLY